MDLNHPSRGRRFSTSINSNARESSAGPFVSSQVGRVHALGSLKVRKQRHSGTAHINRATSNCVPAAKFPRGVTMSYPPSLANHPSAHQQLEADPPSCSTRTTSLTTLRQVPSTQLAHSSQTSLSSLQQQPAELQSKDLRALDTAVVRRDSTLKHRFLSRVMNSLINKPNGNHSASHESKSRRCSTEISGKDGAIGGPDAPGRVSISTVGTYSTLDSDLQTAIDSFPEPPGSILTSPTEVSPTEASPIEHNQYNTQAYRVLCTPSNVTVVRPEVTIIPEFGTLDANDSQSMYIAVQIEAATDAMTKAPSDRSYGLDVAVIIDNSQYASPATLMASCETARFLSSLLDSSNDRMAIICTNSISTERRDLRTILPLSSANPRKTKAAVDTIASSTERPSLSSLDAAVRSARALLEQAMPRDYNSGLGQYAFGHIFVLTTNSTGIAPENLNHSLIQLHLVSTGSVPWKGEGNVRCNGWKMQSTHTKELHSVARSQDEDPTSLFNRLRATINDAHTGQLHGTVGDLILNISSGQDCTIEGVIGSRNVPDLRLGERVVALVKVKVGFPPVTGYTLNPHRQRNDSSSAYDDLDQELDNLLGTTPVTVLEVKLKYRHSLLPSDTQCTLTTRCRLRRQLCSSNGKQSEPAVEIQKRFAFHIATHHAPRQAMMVLIEEFGDGGRRSVCPDYVKLLIEELRYQARTIERFDLAEYRAGPVRITPPELRADARGNEHFGQGLFDASNYKPQDWIMDVPDEIVMELPSSPLKARPHNRSFSEDSKSRTVLKRRPKRPAVGSRNGSGSENRSSVSTEVDDTARQLKDLALKNQRSLETDSSKGLAFSQYRGRVVESYGSTRM
ncbi:MAG: hypothetical protein Q9219_001957 [cf. Caloplaca sp. 3 TL-2023]